MGLERSFTSAAGASNVLAHVLKIVLIILTCVFIVPAVFAYAAANTLIRLLLGLPTNPTEARLAHERKLLNAEERRRRVVMRNHADERKMMAKP